MADQQQQQQPSERTRDRVYRGGRRVIGKVTSFVCNNDGKQILLSPAFRGIESHIKLYADDVGPPGSILRKKHTTDADDGGRLPHLSWTDANPANVKSYALLCEDLDATYPDHMNHGIFYNIPPARRNVTANDVEKQVGTNTPRLTATSWNFVTTHGSNTYLVPDPPANEATHRYVFTIISLNLTPLKFTRPNKVTKKEFHKAIEGKVISWGQWIGSLAPPADKNASAEGANDQASAGQASASAGETTAGQASAGGEASTGQTGIEGGRDYDRSLDCVQGQPMQDGN
ncbi:YbhB/YbcL family Raf kinase inhibitor-like protein [Aspergillus glaucus CBS 516.65]|uniref:Phosphatidylethanolamine-binding protein n=1 Tax=Aspergillus glaucus CBS 516.65 TaxID=1160497 RepID=A0A1L9VKT4_ASPGL|nr:hypothetical protein ASPGLDRAFT_1448320 [Aspergillus glaucus CBS 516.65]OJJ84501.1 hypothetical protein ASPGLDRAFT_1448320 [Aspergillus glaucus CBS 516.65]